MLIKCAKMIMLIRYLTYENGLSVLISFYKEINESKIFRRIKGVFNRNR